MKKISFLLWALCFILPVSGQDIGTFLKKYPSSYQDIIANNQIISLGSDLCSQRYDILKPILDQYETPFNVLDLGAAQGYFSFSIAHDYPSSFCVMIDANTAYYSNHGDILFDLCQLNTNLNNVSYLNKKISITDLEFLNREEHFDVIIAFLVIHMMSDTIRDHIKIVENLLTLGDNVIIEVANDVSVVLSSYVEYLSTKVDCCYLGEITRHRSDFCPYGTGKCPCSGKFFWFKRKNQKQHFDLNRCPFGIKKETFFKLNGVYPTL